MKLSILICTLPERKPMLDNLVTELKKQMIEEGVFDKCQILINTLPKQFSIGNKREWLKNEAKGEYIVFFDDDDHPGNRYIRTLFEGINKRVDVVSLRGIITWDGTRPEIFEHSLKYNAYRTTENAVKYERYPNHLNCMRADLVKQFKFPDKSHGEDTDWATQIHKAGVLKTELYSDEVIYYYDYIPNK